MNRYAAAFAAAQRRGEPLFMPYLMAGFPRPAESRPLLEALIAGGAGALEIGVPFSDPIADGPTIQRASSLALQHGVALPFIMELVADLRSRGADLPITLLSYLNPILSYDGGGEDEANVMARLARDAAVAGVDGLIVVDLPPEESDGLRAALRAHGLTLIYLLAPTSTEARIQAVAERAAGFLYLVSVTGVTGARATLPPDLVEFVGRVRRGSDLPRALGFGVSTRRQVETIGELCEAAVVGSALLTVVEEAPPADRPATLQRFAELLTGRRKGERE